VAAFLAVADRLHLGDQVQQEQQPRVLPIAAVFVTK
jgi:hypothetical protein